MPTIVFTIGTSKRRIHHHALLAELTNVHTWIIGIQAVQGAGTLSLFAIRKRHKLVKIYRANAIRYINIPKPARNPIGTPLGRPCISFPVPGNGWNPAGG
jgi:hypothetical protein